MPLYNVAKILSMSLPYICILCESQHIKKYMSLPLLEIILLLNEKFKNNTNVTSTNNTTNTSINNISNITNNISLSNNDEYVHVQNYTWIHGLGLIKGFIDKLIVEKHYLINNN